MRQRLAFRRFVPGIFVAITLSLMGCAGSLIGGSTVKGSGNLKTDVRQVSGFSQVKLSGVGSLEILQTGTEGLTITAEDNLLPLINTDVTGGVLDIHLQSNVSLQPTKPIVYALSVKDLNTITLSGAGTATAQQFKTNTLTVVLSGAGQITLSGLQVNNFTSQLSGTGTLTVSGTTNAETVNSSGVGTFKGDQLQSATAKVKLSGVGSATVRVSETLDVTISGVGSLTYYGNPTVTQHVSGVGKVNHAQG